VLGIPDKDIFFTLDCDAIRDTFRDLRRANDVLPSAEPPQAFPDYPGHEEFWAAFEKAKERSWKRFLLNEYGIPYDDVSWYARVADRMRNRGIFPEALAKNVDCLAQLAEHDVDGL
jgi:hypothetical protein